MKFSWFKRYGIIFLPISVIGWVILGAAILYAVDVFIDIDSRSHSASDTLMNFVFQLLIIGAAYSLIAFLTSFKAEKSAGKGPVTKRKLRINSFSCGESKMTH